jgi:hypothetical protein
MRRTSFRTAVTVATMFALTACVTTQPQPDGSTKVHLSLGGLAKVSQEAPQPVAGSQSKPTAAVVPPMATGTNTAAAPSIRASAMAGLFAKHPYDGTPKTYYPRAAVTVIDWSRNDCWTAAATIWWSKAKSEAVPPFSVCWGQSLGFSLNNAAQLHLFMEQMAVEHSGNVRSTGPKPPMLAIPDRQPISGNQQLAFQGFIQQLVLDTGWQAGAPTNMWLIGYDKNGGTTAPIVAPAARSPSKQLDGKSRQILEQALGCNGVGKSFDLAESALKQMGWQFAQGVTPVSLSESLEVYGLATRKIAVNRDGFEHTYRSFLPGISLQQVVKAASLKIGRDRKTYGRVTKMGVLTVGIEDGETALTCKVDVEG